MPAEPLTWQAIQFIGAELAVVRKAAGYHTDAGQRVLLEPVQVEDDSACLLVGMRDLRLTEVATRLRQHEFTVVVEAVTPASVLDAEAQAHRAIADVLRVFPSSPRDVVLPGGSGHIAAEAADVLQRRDGVGAAVGQVRLNVRLRETLA